CLLSKVLADDFCFYLNQVKFLLNDLIVSVYILRLHEKNGGDIYIAFNAHDFHVKVPIPSPPTGRSWFRVVDTNLESPDDVVLGGVPGIKDTYNIAPFSSILLEAKQ
ncbi:hypothetical protein Leryth_024054, partial [Lithospermum erythrorhizon]